MATLQALSAEPDSHTEFVPVAVVAAIQAEIARHERAIARLSELERMALDTDGTSPGPSPGPAAVPPIGPAAGDAPAQPASATPGPSTPDSDDDDDQPQPQPQPEPEREPNGGGSMVADAAAAAPAVPEPPPALTHGPAGALTLATMTGAERTEAVAAVFAQRRGEWLSSGEVATALGTYRQRIAPSIHTLLERGRIEDNAHYGSSRRYRAPEQQPASGDVGEGDEDPEPAAAASRLRGGAVLPDELVDGERPLEDVLEDHAQDADASAHAARVPMSRRVAKLERDSDTGDDGAGEPDEKDRLRAVIVGDLARAAQTPRELADRRILNVREVGEKMAELRREGVLVKQPGGAYTLTERAGVS